MKRHKGLFEQIVDLDNIALAAHKAFKGKNAKRSVIEFREEFIENIERLRDNLISGNIEIGNYNMFEIYDPKHRVICAAKLTERIIHHAIMNICHDYFNRNLISDSYASRPNKGIHAAVSRAKRGASVYRYFAKLDVKKFFDSIDHVELKKMLMHMFKEEQLLILLFRIIDSYETQIGKGLPIGNLTSQYFANLYLSGLDHYMKENVHIPLYIRYMDDVLMMCNDRNYLRECVNAYTKYAELSLLLKIKPPIIGNVSTGVNFLGYRIDSKHITLSGKSKRRFRHKAILLNRLFSKGRILEHEYSNKLRSILSFAEHADSTLFIKSCVNIING